MKIYFFNFSKIYFNVSKIPQSKKKLTNKIKFLHDRILIVSLRAHPQHFNFEFGASPLHRIVHERQINLNTNIN